MVNRCMYLLPDWKKDLYVSGHQLYGDVICKVREGTQSGSKIRLRGKGIVSMKNPQVHGDHYVTVQVQVPRNITPEARRKLREFEQACGIRNSYAG